MNREQKIYCKVGQAVCNLFGAAMFFGIPVLGCNLAGYITALF